MQVYFLSKIDIGKYDKTKLSKKGLSKVIFFCGSKINLKHHNLNSPITLIATPLQILLI